MCRTGNWDGLGERVQSRGEPFVGQHRGMESVGDAPQRVDRRLQLGGRRAEKFGAEGVALRDVRPGHAQADQQGDQPLLGAVMEVAFQPAALAIAGRDDPDARGAQIGLLDSKGGLQTLVVECQPHRRGDLVDDLVVVEQSWAMEQDRDGCTVADDWCGSPTIGRRHVEPLPGRVGEPVLADGIHDVERAVVQGAGQQGLQTIAACGGGELDDEAGERSRGSAARSPGSSRFRLRARSGRSPGRTTDGARCRRSR